MSLEKGTWKEKNKRTDHRRWDLPLPTLPPRPPLSLPRHSWKEGRHSPPVPEPNHQRVDRPWPVFVPHPLRPLPISTAYCARSENRDTRYSASCLLRNRLVRRTRPMAVCAVWMVRLKLLETRSIGRSLRRREEVWVLMVVKVVTIIGN